MFIFILRLNKTTDRHVRRWKSHRQLTKQSNRNEFTVKMKKNEENSKCRWFVFAFLFDLSIYCFSLNAFQYKTMEFNRFGLCGALAHVK